MEAPAGRAMNSLGFAKVPADTRVVVAMSGGVDSSVTAAFFSQGYEVTGSPYSQTTALQSSQSACARELIFTMPHGVSPAWYPHYVMDYESRFHDQVMQVLPIAICGKRNPLCQVYQTVKFTGYWQLRELGAGVYRALCTAP